MLGPPTVALLAGVLRRRHSIRRISRAARPALGVPRVPGGHRAVNRAAHPGASSSDPWQRQSEQPVDADADHRHCLHSRTSPGLSKARCSRCGDASLSRAAVGQGAPGWRILFGEPAAQRGTDRPGPGHAAADRDRHPDQGLPCPTCPSASSPRAASWGTLINDGREPALHPGRLVSIAPGSHARGHDILLLNVIGDGVQGRDRPARPCCPGRRTRRAQTGPVMSRFIARRFVSMIVVLFAPERAGVHRSSSPSRASTRPDGWPAAMPRRRRWPRCAGRSASTGRCRCSTGHMMDQLFVSPDPAVLREPRGPGSARAAWRAAPVTLSLVPRRDGYLAGVQHLASACWPPCFGRRYGDQALMVACLVAVSVPVFWLGQVANLVSPGPLACDRAVFLGAAARLHPADPRTR